MGRSFKPIDPDRGVRTEADGLPDFMSQEMTEDERKRWRKKSRKRRSQLRRKLQREANKTSSESGTEPNPEIEVELEGSMDEGSLKEEMEQVSFLSKHFLNICYNRSEFLNQVKPGHRKSRSLTGIQVKDEVPPVTNPVADWVRGGIISRSIGPEFHFFSDTEMEIRSPDGSRPPTPVHSDTEYEVRNLLISFSGAIRFLIEFLIRLD